MTPLPVPDWLRRAVDAMPAQPPEQQGADEFALIAGAAFAALDGVVRSGNLWAGVWRQRLALRAAAMSVRAAGRGEDEAALRDALLLTRPGDDFGPAGQMALVWQRLAARPAQDLLTAPGLHAMLDGFLHAVDDDVAYDAIAGLAEELARLAQNSSGLVAALRAAFAAGVRIDQKLAARSAGRSGLGPVIGAYLADAMLAQRLRWEHAVPLLGSLAARSARPAIDAGRKDQLTPQADAILLAAQARAALRAIDLSAALGRQAQKLCAIAPKLRAKGAQGVVARLLNEDALIASRTLQLQNISERGLRRLFDRLIELDAVRELTGRTTFRIYGL